MKRVGKGGASRMVSIGTRNQKARWGLAACLGSAFAVLSVNAQTASETVGLWNSVRLVDTAVGQDIEITASKAPSSFRPERLERCTFALVVPEMLPGPDTAGQFFASELVERLTLEPVAGAAATRICVRTTAPVRSRVALRTSGMALRLERVEDQPQPVAGESFRSVDAPATQPSAAPATSNSARANDLALREARVEVRELKLELRDLRAQLEAQVGANAVLDQELARRDGVTDQLTPRIERLLRLLSVDGSAFERPVERFDAALAKLDAQLTEASASGADQAALRDAAERVVQSLASSGTELVVTNDDVNVRSGPSTETVRVAFLPRGVQLRVKERRDAWSLVSAGSFEGWIFGELLSSINLDQVGAAPSSSEPSGSAAERLLWAAERTEQLQRELSLLNAQQAGLIERVRTQEAQAVDLAAQTAGAEELARTNAELRAREDQLAVANAQLSADLEAARNRVLELEAALSEERSAQVSEAPQASPDPLHADSLLDAKVDAILSLVEPTGPRVITTDQTNLRRGPGLDQERLALLPAGFALVLEDRRDGWLQVRYGSLAGWLFSDFATEQPADDESIGRSRLERLEMLEQRLSAKGAETADADASARRDHEGVLLQQAADALYEQAAEARAGSADRYLAYFSERFTPQEGSRQEWEAARRGEFERGDFDEAQVQDLSLRRISADLIEARFLDRGARMRLDLVREAGAWRILMATEEVAVRNQP